jgi:hypothetical protein
VPLGHMLAFTYNEINKIMTYDSCDSVFINSINKNVKIITCFFNIGFIVNSSLKNWHSACPIVCAPERTVRSLAVRPLFWNILMRVARYDDGEGSWVLAALWLAVLTSLLPSGSIHEGPPSWKLIETWLIIDT